MPNKIALIVDDDDATREVVGLHFSMMGFEVRFSADGLQALEALKREPISILFLDLSMPHMTGEQLMEEMSNHDQWMKIPIIVDTAQGLGTGRLAKAEKEFKGRLKMVGFTRPGSLEHLPEIVEGLMKP